MPLLVLQSRTETIKEGKASGVGAGDVFRGRHAEKSLEDVREMRVVGKATAQRYLIDIVFRILRQQPLGLIHTDGEYIVRRGES